MAKKENTKKQAHKRIAKNQTENVAMPNVEEVTIDENIEEVLNEGETALETEEIQVENEELTTEEIQETNVEEKATEPMVVPNEEVEEPKEENIQVEEEETKEENNDKKPQTLKNINQMFGYMWNGQEMDY